MEGHDPYAALRYRDYRCLLAGGVTASIGSEIQAVVVGWELYERTGSAWNLGLAYLAQFLPVLLLALPAGQAADRYSRKLVFQLAQTTAALASLALAALSALEGPVELVFVCLLLAGTARAFAAPARASLLAQVVPLGTLGNAVTWNSTGWQIANVTGPALGGLVIGATGHALLAYLLAAVCALACVSVLSPIQPHVAKPIAVARSFESLLAGLRFVWRTKLLLAAITLDLFAVLFGGAVALLPIFAKDILDAGPTGLGWLRAAPAIGAVLIAIVLSHRPPMRRPGRTLLLAVAGFGAATVVFGLSENFALSFAMLGVTGALDNISVVVRGTLMQTLTPDEMRGRVAAVNTVFISSSNELGGFESGLAANLFGPIEAVVGGGVATILVVLTVLWRWPQLYGLGPLHKLQSALDTSSQFANNQSATERARRETAD
ncbi:MAG: MFS transporter [Gemmataceae bacterium]|nr:MFS transporter [Gemmataceae bacterium]